MTRGLPRIVVATLRYVVPRRQVDAVLVDLDDDYRRVRATRSPVAASRWLCREAASLVWAFAARSVSIMYGWRPVWARDLHLVMRGLRRSPLSTLGAAATLGAGVLAVLVTVGLSDALLFRHVSARHGEVVRRVAIVDSGGRPGYGLSYVELEQVRAHVVPGAPVSTANLQPVVLRANGTDLQTMAEVVDGGFFDLIGAPIVLGRGLVSADDRESAPPAVVLGETLWRRHYGADPAVVGSAVAVNGAPFTVVGVAALGGSASALGAGVDAWTPLAHGDSVLSAGWRTDVDARWFSVFVLPRGDVAEVDARLSLASRELARRQPEAWRTRVLRTEPGTVLTGGQRRSVTSLAWTLGALAVLILAAGIANVSGVLIARAAAAERHTAIHLSMGAGRASIVRRLLLEGAVLGLMSGGLAVALYAWVRRALAEVALLPTLSLRLDLPFDGVVVATAVVVSGGVGLLLAVGPAIWSARVDERAALGGGDARTVGGRSVSRARRALVSAQVCASLALVVGSTLFSRSLGALEAEDVGFPRRGLVAMDFDLAPAVSPERALLLAQSALDQAAALPGVTTAAMANRAPVDQSTPVVDVRHRGAEATVGEVTLTRATAGYFDTIGLPLVAGRAFTAEECEAEADVAIVNASLARRLWMSADPIGRALTVGTERRVVRVVGVAGDSKYRSLADAGRSHLYRPARPGFHLTLLARVSGDPREGLRALQRVLDGVGPGVVGFFPRTFDDHVAIELLPTKSAAYVAALLGSLALLLSALGIYGLMAWFVDRRRREIGVRMAIGASPAAVVRLVVVQAAQAVAPGIVAGVCLAVALGIVARSVLHGVGPLDPLALAAGVAALTAVVGAAAWLPGRRAARLDPATALRDP